MSNLESIFHAATALPEAQRAAYLNEACAGDEGLRADVEALLIADAKAATFMAGLENQIQSVLKHHQETGTKIGRYRIDRKIASGGMGSVYQAWDSRLNRDVALKFLHPHFALDITAKQRFIREAHAVSKLNHPNICTIHDVGESDNGEQYIVMELCEGTRLDQLIDMNGLSYGSIFNITNQLCDGLTVAHEKDILHRDLKPQNIIIDKNENVKLLDFGIAKVIDRESTKTSQAVGTIAYMSPEQFKAGKQDTTADIWALGALFFEMITGTLPFQGNSQPEIMHAIFSQNRPSLISLGCDLPITFEEFFDRALAHHPEHRFNSMQSFKSGVADLALFFREGSSYNETPRYASRHIDRNNNSGVSSQNERRNVTVLHFRTIADNIDPEERAQSIIQLDDIFKKIIRRFGAHQFSNGSGELSAYFGYPKADEHSTIQGVRCAVGLKEALQRRQISTSTVALKAQIGVHTDVLITRETNTTGELELLGEGPAIAQNLSFNAAPDQILISQSTAKLVAGFFATNELQTSFGPVFEVLRESRAQSKFDVAVEAGLSPISGRIHELGMLKESWQQTLEGEGRVMAISGDPGIGKSRLVYELKQEIAHSAEAWLVECQCSPYETNSTLYPVIRYFREDVLEFNDALSQEEKQSRVEGFLVEYDFSDEDVTILSDFFGAPLPAMTQNLISPEQRQIRIFAGLARLLKQRASLQPILVIFEDLHWADLSTNKLIQQLLSDSLPPNVMLLMTFRPQFKPQWLISEHVTHLAVQRLSKQQSTLLINNIIVERHLPDTVRSAILGKSDGNPLYIETLTRSVCESGPDSIETIPNSLQDSLMARLDQLGPAKSTAQFAAVIGREFDLDLLAQSTGISVEQTQIEIKQLVTAQLVIAPQRKGDKYRFKHALVRDAAYDSLLKADRRLIHAKIAEKLAHNQQSSAALLATHYAAAGLHSQAAKSWLAAGQHALHQDAVREAIDACEKGLEEANKVADHQSIVDTKIDLLLTLSPALIAARGYTDVSLASIYDEALDLSNSIDAQDKRFSALFGAFTFYVVSADHPRALEITEQLLAIATAADDLELLAEAYMAHGISQYFTADFLGAKRSFGKVIDIYQPTVHGKHALIYGQDPKMISLAFSGWIEFILGNSAVAQEISVQAINHARSLNHPFSLTYALVYNGATQLYCRKIDAARHSISEALDLCIKYKIRGVESLGRVFAAMIDVFENPSPDTIKAAENCIEFYHNTGANMFLTAWNVELAYANLALNKHAEASNKFELAAAQISEFGETWYLFPLLQGQSLLAKQRGDIELAKNFSESAISHLNATSCHGWRSQKRFGIV